MFRSYLQNIVVFFCFCFLVNFFFFKISRYLKVQGWQLCSRVQTLLTSSQTRSCRKKKKKKRRSSYPTSAPRIAVGGQIFQEGSLYVWNNLIGESKYYGGANITLHDTQSIRWSTPKSGRQNRTTLCHFIPLSSSFLDQVNCLRLGLARALEVMSVRVLSECSVLYCRATLGRLPWRQTSYDLHSQSPWKVFWYRINLLLASHNVVPYFFFFFCISSSPKKYS